MAKIGTPDNNAETLAILEDLTSRRGSLSADSLGLALRDRMKISVAYVSVIKWRDSTGISAIYRYEKNGDLYRVDIGVEEGIVSPASVLVPWKA